MIPEYGTLHRGGNVVILDLGKLKIESELQPKNLSMKVRTEKFFCKMTSRIHVYNLTCLLTNSKTVRARTEASCDVNYLKKTLCQAQRKLYMYDYTSTGA